MHTIEALDFLRCPEDHTELSPAADELIRQINVAIRSGRICNRAGRRLSEWIDGGLVRARGDVLYPVIGGIPILLRDEAIAVVGKPGADS